MNAKIAPAASEREALLSVAEAATFLRISQSTLWRWIDHETVRAYRIGPKRVWLKKADLEPLVAPARQPDEKGGKGMQQERRTERRLSANERARGLAAIDEARKFQAKLLAERGGKLFSPGWELLHEAREERLQQLT